MFFRPRKKDVKEEVVAEKMQKELLDSLKKKGIEVKMLNIRLCQGKLDVVLGCGQNMAQ